MSGRAGSISAKFISTSVRHAMAENEWMKIVSASAAAAA